MNARPDMAVVADLLAARMGAPAVPVVRHRPPSGLPHLVRSLCRLRASAKARGQHHLTHERRCARLVLQGMISQAMAENALAVLLMGIYCRDQPSTDIDAAWWLERAKERLQRAMDTEQVQRGLTARAIKDQAENDIQARLPSASMIERARAVNAEMGLSLAWPEILALLIEELRWHDRARRRPRRRGA